VRVWSPLKSTAEALLIIDRRGSGGGAASGSGLGGGGGGPAGQMVGGASTSRTPVGRGVVGGGGCDKNGLLADEVKQANFFYMDRFLSLVVGGRILLYELKIANDAADDLERLRKKHRFREVASFQSRAGMCVCVHACMHVCMFECLYVFVYICTYV